MTALLCVFDDRAATKIQAVPPGRVDRRPDQPAWRYVSPV